MKRIYILMMFVSVSVLISNALDLYDVPTSRRLNFNAYVTSSESCGCELQYHYMPVKYVGVGGGLGLWTVFKRYGWPEGYDWELCEDDVKPGNMYVKPSVLLRSPSVRLGSIGLGLSGEAGMMINIPYQQVEIERYTYFGDKKKSKHISTTDGQWCAFDIRLGLYVSMGVGELGIGYYFSNLDVYSQYRHLSYDGISFSEFYPTKRSMQGGFVSLSVYM